MQSPENLAWERWLLELVYEPEQFEILHSDAPDFRLTRGAFTFGVEVTEMFRDGPDARIHRVSGYLDRLAGGGDHLHKNDIEQLKVVAVDILDKDGNEKAKGVMAVLREESMSKQHHYDLLAEVIERKTQAFARYDQGLEHINLLIGDHLDPRVTIGDEFSTTEIFTPRLREALTASPFREVFLVSRVHYANSSWLPLKQLEFVESFFVYLEALKRTLGAVELVDPQDIAALFVAAARPDDAGLSLRDEGGYLFASRGDCAIAYRDGVIVHEYADCAPTGELDRDHSASRVDAALHSAIVQEFKLLRAGLGFVSRYSRPVRKPNFPEAGFLSKPDDEPSPG